MLAAPSLLSDAGVEVPAGPPSLDYYRLDNRRLTLAECWRFSRSWKVVFMWLAKLGSGPTLSVSGFPVPRSLRENVSTLEELPSGVAQALVKLQPEGRTLGFDDPIYYQQKDSLSNVESGACILQQPSGETLMTLLYARTSGARPGPEMFAFLSQLADGRLLVTSNTKKRFNPPPGSDDLVRMEGASATSLLAAHYRRLEAYRTGGNPPMPIVTFDDLCTVINRNERRHYDFNLARSVYVPMTAVEVEAAFAQRFASQRAKAVSSSPAVGEEAAAVLAALAKRESPTSSNAAGSLVLLLVSLAAYALIGRLRWKPETVGLILGALLLHETGHYLAMRAFGYRNLKMFFIPFFGAAVSGLNTRAAGWQKALVALAGPVPGIALGAGMLLLARSQPDNSLFLSQAGRVLIGLNAFNLLPLLPLDGGRLFQETIFNRHPVLRVGFSLLAGVGLFALAYHLGSQLLGILGFFMLVTIGHTLRVDRAVRRLRAEGIALTEPAPVPGQDDVIRPEALPSLLDAIKARRDKPPTRPVLVQEALAVIDQFRVRPPGVASTLGLLALYGAAVATAVFFFLPVYSQYSGARARRASLEKIRQQLVQMQQAKPLAPQQYKNDSTAKGDDPDGK